MVDVEQRNNSQIVNVVTVDDTQNINVNSSTSTSPVSADNNQCKYYEELARQHAESASQSATSAGSSATSASTSATNAYNSSQSASTSATNASESEDNAEIWAEGSDAEVQALGGTHSAKEWADKYSHVYIGTTQPTDAEVDVWIDPSGTDTPYVTDVKVNNVSVTTNRVANIDLTGKQDVISDLSTIRTNATHGESAYNTIQTYGNIVTHNTSEFQVAGDYATNTALTQGLATKQNVLTAGNNIQISNNVISATDTTYTAGTGISIVGNVISNTQTSAEWGNITGTLSNQTDLKNALDGKQATISDLNDIRAGADLGATALQPNDNITQLTNNAGYITTSALSGYATETYVNNHHDSTKVDKNNAITSATKCKITYDSKGLVTSGTDLTTSDIPDLSSAYMTLATNQTVTSKKTLSLTETVVEGGQETILNVLSTHTNDEMTQPMWTGRVKIGNKNKTFLLGVYRQTYYGSPPICGIGAHSWSNSFTEQDAAWEDVYLNPDGDKAVYIGGKDWRANTGWLKVQNSGSDYNGKVYYNKGSIASPNFQEVAVVSDLTAKENTSNKVTSISSSSTNTQYPSAKCVYDIVGNIEATLQTIRGV